MPQYTYKCRSCEHTHDQVLTIAERKTPMEYPCSECGESSLYIQIQPTKISYQGNMKTTGEFNDRLKDIKNNLPPEAQQKITDQIR